MTLCRGGNERIRGVNDPAARLARAPSRPHWSVGCESQAAAPLFSSSDSQVSDCGCLSSGSFLLGRVIGPVQLYTWTHAVSPPMRVLVTGATGFTGGHLMKALIRHGHQVRAFVRSPEQVKAIEQKGAETFVGQITRARDLIDAARGCEQIFILPRCFVRLVIRRTITVK
jgi:hypothetical protein